MAERKSVPSSGRRKTGARSAPKPQSPSGAVKATEDEVAPEQPEGQGRAKAPTDQSSGPNDTGSIAAKATPGKRARSTPKAEKENPDPSRTGATTRSKSRDPASGNIQKQVMGAQQISEVKSDIQVLGQEQTGKGLPSAADWTGKTLADALDRSRFAVTRAFGEPILPDSASGSVEVLGEHLYRSLIDLGRLLPSSPSLARRTAAAKAGSTAPPARTSGRPTAESAAVPDAAAARPSEDVYGRPANGSSPIEGQEVDDDFISGSPQIVGLWLAHQVEQAAGAEMEQARLLTGMVANTLGRLERRQEITGEALADVANVILVALRPNVDWIARGQIQLVPMLRDVLERDKERGHGWYQSLAMLAGLMSRIEDMATDAGLRRIGGDMAVFYYHEVLECYVTGEKKETEVEGNLVRVISAAANNVAASIGRRLEAERKDRGERSLASGVARRLVKINLAGSIDRADVERLGAGDKLLDRLHLPAPELGGPTTDGLTEADQAVHQKEPIGVLLIAIDEAQNVPTASQWNDDSVFAAYLKVVAGVVRALLGKEDRTAAAFFNAGVSLLAIPRDRLPEEGLEPRARTAMAIILNAVGFAWSLQLNSELAIAMGPGDGEDCLVNFWGGILDLTQQDREDLRAHGLEGLASFTARVAEFPTIPQAKRVRLQTAIRRANLSVTAEALDPSVVPNLCLSLCRRILFSERFLLKFGKLPREIWDAVDRVEDVLSPEYTASLLAGSFICMLGGVDQFDARIAKDIYGQERLGSYLSLADGSWKDVLIENYRPYSEDGPLVAAGVMTKETWKSLAAKSRVSCPSLADAFRSVFRMA